VSGPSAPRLKIPRELRRQLERRARTPKASHRDVLRARIALLAATGLSNAEIGRRLGCDIKTVRKWRSRIGRWAAVEALMDAPRTGRPPRVSVEAHQELIKLACQRVEDSKVPFRKVWTLSSLADALFLETGVQLGRTEVWRVLHGWDLRPHRVRLWLHSPDPDFRTKVATICRLYTATPEGATVLCVDEKPGMQALEHRFPKQAVQPGAPGRKEFEYIRRGTRSLIAGFNIRTGHVIARCGPTRKAVDLLAFMEQVAMRYPKGPVYIIWDNLNIHYGERWREFNERHGGRFHYVYTPLHASWVNQVEIWFSILARRVLKHASFASASALTAEVRAFIGHWNRAEAHAFRWTFRARWRSVQAPRAA
jgi:transposase